MEVMTSFPPAGPADLHFGGASPHITTPFPPLRFGAPFYSAPASPAKVSAAAAAEISTGNTVPFDWEADNGEGFAFDFSGQLETTSISPADELFEGGKIKPLIPPQGKESDPERLPAAPARIPEGGNGSSIPRRGSEINGNPTARRSNSRRKSTRSLSPTPFRATQFDQDEPEIEIQDEKDCSSSFLSTWYRKWRLKDLLLFRSASEGRESGRGMMNRYAMLQKRQHLPEDARISSSRSTESVGSTSSRRRGPLSAHELHYTLNRAASEEMKRKTFLPYKQGLFGCLGFHQTPPAAAAAAADISKGIPSKSVPRSRHR